MGVGHDEVCDSDHDSETFTITPFRKSLLIFFLPDISDYGGQGNFKGLSSLFSTTFLEFGVRYIVFHHFFHIKVLWLVDRPHLMMKAPMVSLLAHVLGFCVSLFRGINFPLVLWTHLPIFLTLRLVFSIFFSDFVWLPLRFFFLE